MHDMPKLASRVTFDPSTSSASHSIISASEKRIALTFFAPATGSVTLSNETPAVAGNGIVMGAGHDDVNLWLGYHGDVIQREWYAVYSGTFAPVAWIDTLG